MKDGRYEDVGFCLNGHMLTGTVICLFSIKPVYIFKFLHYEFVDDREIQVTVQTTLTLPKNLP